MFRHLSDSVLASPQISLADISEAKALGVGLVINNRPEGESDDQVPGAEIEAAARALARPQAAARVADELDKLVNKP